MSGRIAALDVLRGVAILGTFGTNVWVFANPGGPTGFLTMMNNSGIDGGALLRALSNGKFLGLLSIMFGIGLAIQHRSAVRHGRRWPGWYLWRSALLLVEGLLHYLLIFEFDVLAFYAVVSVAVAFLVARRTATRWMIGVGVLHVALVGLFTLGLLLNGGAEAADPGSALPLDSWWGMVQDRVEHFAAFRAEGVFVLPLSTVLFLAGAALFRAGALEDSERGLSLQRRLVAWGLGVGVPLNVVTALSGPTWFLVDRYLCAPLVSFGLLGGITWLVNRMRAEQGPLRAGLSAVGRTALTCYIGQNLIASLLCYPWALGLSTRFSGPWFTAAVWASVSALLVLGATWWTRRFERGPVEALWDRFYRAPQRLVRRTPAGQP
ncbi:DUF418 domain-containing protein [Saccharothrix sp. Mg75]|uniref:DUF418 domain-containing protein n=1 Tax=Saccharothrix sp. Mg75 TaxID=3445357 RepID=UPI003EEE50F2